MENNMNYEEVKEGYWVYVIQVPSVGKFYIGISKQKCNQRWRKSQYLTTVLNQYLDEWDSMIKTVLVDNLTKEQAYQYEDNIIQALSINNLCINERRSGLIFVSDENAYYRERRKQHYQNNSEFREKEKQRSKQNYKQHYQNNSEYIERRKQRNKQWQLDNKEKYQEYQKQYRENNKEKAREYKKEWYKRKKLEQQQNNILKLNK